MLCNFDQATPGTSMRYFRTGTNGGCCYPSHPTRGDRDSLPTRSASRVYAVWRHELALKPWQTHIRRDQVVWGIFVQTLYHQIGAKEVDRYGRSPKLLNGSAWAPTLRPPNGSFLVKRPLSLGFVGWAAGNLQGSTYRQSLVAGHSAPFGS